MTTGLTSDELERLKRIEFNAQLEKSAGQFYVDQQREREAAEAKRKSEREARAKQRCELVAEQLAANKKDPTVSALLAALGGRDYTKPVESPLSFENVRHLSVDDFELCAKVSHALCDGEPVDYVLEGWQRAKVRKLLARYAAYSNTTTLREMASQLARSIVDDFGTTEFACTLAAVATLVFLANHGHRATVDLDTFVADFRERTFRTGPNVVWERVEQRLAPLSKITVW